MSVPGWWRRAGSTERFVCLPAPPPNQVVVVGYLSVTASPLDCPSPALLPIFTFATQQQQHDIVRESESRI